MGKRRQEEITDRADEVMPERLPLSAKDVDSWEPSPEFKEKIAAVNASIILVKRHLLILTLPPLVAIVATVVLANLGVLSINLTLPLATLIAAIFAARKRRNPGSK